MHRVQMRMVTKLFLFCFLSMMLVVGGVSFAFLSYLKSNAVNQYGEAKMLSLQSMRDQMDSQLGMIQIISTQMINQEEWIQAINRSVALNCEEQSPHKQVGDECYTQTSYVRDSIYKFSKNNPFIKMITLYSEPKSQLNLKELDDRISTIDNPYFDYVFYDPGMAVQRYLTQMNLNAVRIFLEQKNSYTWERSKIVSFSEGWDDRFRLQSNQGASFPFLFKIPSTKMPFVGVIDVSTELLLSSEWEKSFLEGEQIQVVASDMRAIAAADPNQIGQIVEGNLQQVVTSKQGFIRLDAFKRGEQLVSYIQLEKTGWYLIDFIPIQSIPTISNHTVILVASMLILLVGMISTLVAVFAQRAIARPFQKLLSAISSVERGETRIERVSIQSTDEMGMMGRAINFVADLLDREIEQANLFNQHRQQIKYLLDNAGHGIITFHSDLLIHHDYSTEMDYVYRQQFVAKDFISLTFPAQDEQFARNIFEEVFHSSSWQKQQTFLSLLPSEVKIKFGLYQIEYKMITKNDLPACMVIFTDITEKRALELKLDHEMQTMKMVVKALQNRKDVLQSIKMYERFVLTGSIIWLDQLREKGFSYVIDALYRQVHTFKGTFAQFHFAQLPLFLHQLEDRLTNLMESEIGPDQNEKELEELLKKEYLNQALEADLNELRTIIGDDFFKTQHTQVIDEQLLDELENWIVGKMAPEERTEIRERFMRLRFVKFKELFEPYPPLISELAERLGKVVKPLQIEGGNMLVNPLRVTAFTQSLIHLFRNTIDHGIEAIDERLEKGKKETGRITCKIEEKEGGIQIEIADDGRGIDKSRVLRKAIQKGICSPEAAQRMSLDEIYGILFLDHFSTNEEVNDLSGRGIGMSAVKSEVERIGGVLDIQSELGKGTTFTMWIPSETRQIQKKSNDTSPSVEKQNVNG